MNKLSKVAHYYRKLGNIWNQCSVDGNNYRDLLESYTRS
jgi:hypothetical protein